MGFKSVDELDKFNYDECQIINIEAAEGMISLELEALIVMPNNSQNTNYTKSYAGTTMLRLDQGTIKALVKEGYKRYDANDKLLEAVPDEEVSAAEYESSLKSFKDCFLYKLEKCGDDYILGIEIPAEDDPQGIESDIYRLTVGANKAIFTWERYMNRVQE